MPPLGEACSDGDSDYLLYARGEQKDEAQEFPNGGCTYNGAGCEPDDPRLLGKLVHQDARFYLISHISLQKWGFAPGMASVYQLLVAQEHLASHSVLVGGPPKHDYSHPLAKCSGGAFIEAAH